MSYDIEKRRCRRFVIPGAAVKYKKTGLLSFGKGFSGPYSVENVSKGGLSFVCDKKLSRGKTLELQLLTPNEEPLLLKSVVRVRRPVKDTNNKIIGIEFMPFGSRRGWNSQETLDGLRMLDKKYGGD